MGLFGSDPPKAQILCLEASKMDVEAQFNPTDFEYTRTTQWGGGKQEEGGCSPGVWASPWGSMQFTGGSADTMTVTLLFDEGEKRDEGLMVFVPQFGMPSALAGKLGLAELLLNENSVVSRKDMGDVAKLHKLTLPLLFKQENGNEVMRPPICAFIWGDFQFQGVIQDLKVKFNLFDANGVPRRAECTVTMKGRALSQATSAADFLAGTDYKGDKGGDLSVGEKQGSKVEELIDILAP